MLGKRIMFFTTLSTGWACSTVMSGVHMLGGMRLQASLPVAKVATATALEATTLLAAAALFVDEGAPAGAFPARVFERVMIKM